MGNCLPIRKNKKKKSFTVSDNVPPTFTIKITEITNPIIRQRYRSKSLSLERDTQGIFIIGDDSDECSDDEYLSYNEHSVLNY